MFFFFVGGVSQEVRQVLKTGIGSCFRCGTPTSLVEYDNVLKLFFVPVWRWPGKGQAIHCSECEYILPYTPPIGDSTDDLDSPSLLSRNNLCCRSCSRPIHGDFSFCPYCGSRV